MQTQRRAWKHFQQYSVVSFVVSMYVVVAFGLSLFEETQHANFVRDAGKTVATCSRLDGLAHVLESGVSGTMALSSAYPTSSAVEVNGLGVYAEQSSSLISANACSSDKAGLMKRTVDGASDASDLAFLPTLARVRAKLARTAHRLIATKRSLPSSDTIPLDITSQDQTSLPSGALAIMGSSSGNVFPFGQCTWWANQRYHQLHGVFVPWTNNANAYQWVARAYQYGWRVSGMPTRGSIIVLQSGVQGAYALGHVGVVERVLGDGMVIASSMNWGNHANAVTESVFRAGPGVAFLTL